MKKHKRPTCGPISQRKGMYIKSGKYQEMGSCINCNNHKHDKVFEIAIATITIRLCPDCFTQFVDFINKRRTDANN